MNLEKAIKILKENRDVAKHRADGLEKNKLTDFLDIQYKIDKEDYEAIDTVLSALERLQKSEEDLMKKTGKITCEMSLKLDERYNKGYQDGFKQAKFDCEMDKLDGR